MQQLLSAIDQQTVYAFMLLLARILSFMAFMPIVSHKTVNPTIRIAITFYVTIFMFPLVDMTHFHITQTQFVLALLSEITLGLVASFLVQLAFYAVQIIGDLIGYATALSMANMFDPTTGTQQGIISRLLYLIVLVIYLESGMYEVTLLMLGNSIGSIHLGEFNIYNFHGVQMLIKEIDNMFIFAFSFALPLFFVGFILDIYYGYGTKSMPSFSPFIVTFQIKFTLIFIFLMLGLETFSNQFVNYFVEKFSY